MYFSDVYSYPPAENMHRFMCLVVCVCYLMSARAADFLKDKDTELNMVDELPTGRLFEAFKTDYGMYKLIMVYISIIPLIDYNRSSVTFASCDC